MHRHRRDPLRKELRDAAALRANKGPQMFQYLCEQGFALGSMNIHAIVAIHMLAEHYHWSTPLPPSYYLEPA